MVGKNFDFRSAVLLIVRCVMDIWYDEYKEYCEKCDLLELIPLTFDEWLNKEFE